MDLSKYLFSAFVLISLISCKSEAEDELVADEELPEESVLDGKIAASLYTEFCQSCHGESLESLFDKGSAGKSKEFLTEIITAGNERNGMPAYGSVLKATEISALVDYIKNYDFTANTDTSNLTITDLTTEIIADNLEIPWGMDFLPNGDLLVSEKKGRLSRISSDGKQHEISGLPNILVLGQGGLLDILLHPNFINNQWLYITYTYRDDNFQNRGNTAVMRAKLADDKLSQIEVLYKAIPATSSGQHFGSRLAIDGKGFLYFSVGDRGNLNQFPQSLENSNGKIHRLHDDGRIPANNPFVNQPNVEKSIFSYGHRNPQGLIVHPKTDEVWSHEHGPRGGDEINLVKSGQNHGWPVISYGINYNGSILTELTQKQGMEQPLHYYVPSIAPSGMTFLDNDIYPGWENSFFIGALSLRYLERVKFNGITLVEREELLKELNSRVRNVKVGNDGYIYIATDASGGMAGKILKLVPKFD